MKSLLPIAAIAATLVTASAAVAAPAQVTTTLNLRTGPGTGYRVETAMPAGAVVDVAGCTSGYNWCRVRWNGYDGWASSSYLASREVRYRHRRFNNYGAQIGIPLVAGAVIGGILSNHDHGHGHRVVRHRTPSHGRPADRGHDHGDHNGRNAGRHGHDGRQAGRHNGNDDRGHRQWRKHK